MNDNSVVKISAACLGTGLLGGIVINSFLNKLKSPISIESVPKKWIQVGTVSEIIMYPVKSLPGFQVQEAVATPLGLKAFGNNAFRDRIFMIINSKATFQTQRLIPFMTQIQTSVQDGLLKLYLVTDPTENILVHLPKDEKDNKRICRIYNDKIEALDCGDEVANWLCKVINISGLRLVYHSLEKTQRNVAANQAKFSTFSYKDTGSLQDETSYMLMTEESMEDLNTNLRTPITSRSFRPCILIKGSPRPYAEDLWSFIRIGDTNPPIFKTSMPCQRCKITTIDPDTGNVREDGEPIKTLKSRKLEFGSESVSKLVDNMAIMGTHMGLYNKSEEDFKIKIGDPVYAALL